MSEVIPAKLEMIEEIASLHFSPDIDERRRTWLRQGHRSIFECRWDREGHCPGYVLVHHGRIAGFLGAYYSQQLVTGRSTTFCNLTLWMVSEPHRNESLRLLLPFLKDRSVVVTVLTAAPHVYPIYRGLGFHDCETAVWIVALAPALHRLHPRARCFTLGEPLKSNLDAPNRQVYEDHLPYDCHHLLVQSADASCYVIFSFTRKRRFRMAYFHYVSDLTAFALFEDDIKAALLLRFRVLFMCVEARWLPRPRSRLRLRYQLRVPRIFRGPELPPEKVNGLYSELIAARVFRDYFY